MSIRTIKVVAFGFCLGAGFAIITGFGVDTWQWWAIVLPIVIFAPICYGSDYE